MSRKLSDDDRAVWAAFEQGLRGIYPTARSHQQLPLRAICLDLHGLTVEAAYARVMQALGGTQKYIMVITGRSGKIRHEFPSWMASQSQVRHVEEMNGGGAFKVYLVKELRR